MKFCKLLLAFILAQCYNTTVFSNKHQASNIQHHTKRPTSSIQYHIQYSASSKGVHSNVICDTWYTTRLPPPR